MQTLLLLLQLLKLALNIFDRVQRQRLSAEATQEMLDDLDQAADYLITRSNLARAEVKDTPDEIASDSFNRDRT